MNNDIKEIGIRTFFNICEKWCLKDSEIMTLLGSPKKETLKKMKNDPVGFEINDILMERITYILNIHALLKGLLSTYEEITNWINKPNNESPFNGKSAMEIMLCGELNDLSTINNYLSGESKI